VVAVSLVPQDHLVGEQLVGLVVDQKDVDFLVHGFPSLAMQPHPQRGQ
jgi:hypothetical protein